MEWLEYVRRKATFPGPSAFALALVTLSLVFTEAVLFARPWRVGLPRDEFEDIVSNESVPSSCCDGIGGIMSPGANRPFLVVVEVEREPSWNRPFALGAEATRRIKRDALAPIAFGDSGPDREGVGGELCANDSWDAFAVSGGALWARPSPRCFSAFICLSCAFASSSSSGCDVK